MDLRSRLEALSRFNGKPPAIRGLPSLFKEIFCLSSLEEGDKNGFLTRESRVKAASVLPRLKCGQAGKSSRYRKPLEFIQDPSPQKTAEDLSPEERASTSAVP